MSFKPYCDYCCTWHTDAEGHIKQKDMDLLTERQTTHGSFETNASIAQEIKSAMRASPQWHDLSDVRKEALEFIASKIGRILSGKANFEDHWADIQGYAELAKK